MGYQNHITWAWHNPGPPSGPMGGECAAVVINGVQRGTKTAHDCVAECINTWVTSQNLATALEWLTKGAQCHNKEAQKELNAAGAAAVRYAVETYGPLIHFGDLKLDAFDKPVTAGKEKAATTEKTKKASPAPKAEKAPVAAKSAKSDKAPVAAKATKAPAAAKTEKAPAAKKASEAKAPKKTK